MTNDVLRAIAAHRSIRSYKRTPVPDEAIETAVRAAQMAATSSWVQAYSLLQITDPEKRVALRELCGGQAQVEEAGAFFVVAGDARRHQLVASGLGKPYEPNLETFLLAVVDATLFAQNLTLAFESMGFGACYIGGLRNRLPEVDELLALPGGVFPLFGLCVGEAADDPGQRPRLTVEAVWMKDGYAADADVLAGIARHDDDAAAYYAERGAPGRNWTGGLWRKFRAPVREHLLGYYGSKGARFA